MRKTTAKILAMVLTVVMLVGIAPVSAFAQEAEPAEAQRVKESISAPLEEEEIIEHAKPENVPNDTLVASGQCGDDVYYTFDGESGLLTISGTGEIGGYGFPFYGNDSIKSVVIGDGVTSISGLTFYDCTSLTNISIPDSVKNIVGLAFRGCESLTSIEIPDSVTSIGDGAFENCSSLTSVTIGSGITLIGDDVFFNTGYYNDESNWENDVLYMGNCLIEAKDSVGGGYVIKDGTVCVAAYAFDDCATLTSVIIPDSVTSIGYYAFENCSSLTSAKIGNSVTIIASLTFSNCSSLTSIIIPDSVTSIGYGAFENCSSLTSIEIPDGVTSIGDYTFYGCTSLTSIKIPDSVTSIGSHAFYNCTNLTSIEIPDSVTSICEWTFCNCYSLTSVKISDSVTNIDECAFYGCSSLGSFEIPNSVTSIGDAAFNGCKSLTSIEIPDSVTSIGDYMFVDCETLTIHCYKGSYAHQYAIDNEIPFELIEVDDTTGIKIGISSGIYDGDVTLEVEEVQSGTSFELVGQVENAVASKVFSIKTVVDGQETQPNGNVTVKIPIPEGFDVSKCKLYYLDTANNQAVEVDFTVEGNYIVFTTNHFSDWAVVEISGHDHIPGQAVKENEVAPTCTEQGSYDEVVYCTSCGEEISREKKNVEALGHNYDSVVTNPTCTEAGYTTHTCSRCKDSYTDSTVEATGHTEGEWEVTVPATTTSEGTKTLRCSVCKKVIRTETIPMLTEQPGVNSVSISDISLGYKSSATLTPQIKADEGAKYDVTYKSNSSAVSVDNSGRVTSNKTFGFTPGSAVITVTVTDSNGNTVTDTCTVTVQFSAIQWIIKIVLFGWIWY